MSSNDPKNPKTTDKAASTWTTSQPQKHFRPAIDEETIPWAEIIFEEDQEQPLSLAPRGVETSAGMVDTQVRNPLYEQVVGPPLAVLAIVVIVFLLLLVGT